MKSSFDPASFVVKNLDTGDSFKIDEGKAAKEALQTYLRSLSTFASTGKGRSFRVALRDTDEAQSLDGDTYTVYNIEVAFTQGYFQETALMKHWVVERRFKEFVELDLELRTLRAGAEKLPALPPKKWFGNKATAVVEQRKVALETWLEAMLTVYDDAVRSTECMCRFLGVPDEYRQMNPQQIDGAGSTVTTISSSDSPKRGPSRLISLAEAATLYPHLRRD